LPVCAQKAKSSRQKIRELCRAEKEEILRGRPGKPDATNSIAAELLSGPHLARPD
jgi:hypothetical protein